MLVHLPAWALAHEWLESWSGIVAQSGLVVDGGADYASRRSVLGESHSVPGWRTRGGLQEPVGDQGLPCGWQC